MIGTVPYYYLDPSTGQPMVRMPDGRVTTVGGGTDAAVDHGAGGAGYPPPQTPARPQPHPVATPAAGDYRVQPPALDAVPERAPGTFQPRNAITLYSDGGGSLRAGMPQSAAPAPNEHPGRGTPGGTGGGGGGSAIYHSLRDKLTAKGTALESKVRGMASGVGGGSSSAYGGSSSYGRSSYGRSSYTQPAEPEPERMRGRYAHGLDPDQALGLAYRPTAMLPIAMKGLSGASPLYQMLSELPAYQLGILGKRNFDGSPSDVANAVGNFYEDAGKTNRFPQFNELMRNLSNPKKGGGIDAMFRGVEAKKGEPTAYGSEYAYGQEPLGMGEAAYQYQTMLDAVLQTTLPAETAAKYASAGNFLIDKASAKAMKRPAGRGKTINEVVGRRLMR